MTWERGCIFASINGRHKLSPWDALTFLFVFPRKLFAEMLFLIVTYSLRNVHRMRIVFVRIRIHLLIQMPTVTFAVHNLAVFVFLFRMLIYDKCRMPGFQILPEMRIRFFSSFSSVPGAFLFLDFYHSFVDKKSTLFYYKNAFISKKLLPPYFLDLGKEW